MFCVNVKGNGFINKIEIVVCIVVFISYLLIFVFMVCWGEKWGNSCYLVVIDILWLGENYWFNIVVILLVIVFLIDLEIVLFILEVMVLLMVEVSVFLIEVVMLDVIIVLILLLSELFMVELIVLVMLFFIFLFRFDISEFMLFVDIVLLKVVERLDCILVMGLVISERDDCVFCVVDLLVLVVLLFFIVVFVVFIFVFVMFVLLVNLVFGWVFNCELIWVLDCCDKLVLKDEVLLEVVDIWVCDEVFDDVDRLVEIFCLWVV